MQHPAREVNPYRLQLLHIRPAASALRRQSSPQHPGENATIWTSGAAGQIDQRRFAGERWSYQRGRQGAVCNGRNRIDATGKHLTPGLIDAHSHTAANGGINESTSSVTAEVRVADVIDATAISIYRQLAGAPRRPT